MQAFAHNILLKWNACKFWLLLAGLLQPLVESYQNQSLQKLYFDDDPNGRRPPSIKCRISTGRILLKF